MLSNFVREPYRFLLNNQPEISFEELYDLLKDNQLTNFDPVTYCRGPALICGTSSWQKLS